MTQIEKYKLVVTWERDEGAEIQAIVDRVTEGFRQDVKRIMEADRKPHRFSLHTPSGIRLCKNCGVHETSYVGKGCDHDAD